jgi:YbbR domain-containing protein
MMSFIREKLLENWILKITAIFLAWILWLFIQSESGTVTTVQVPVKLQQMPAGMEVSSGLPLTVQVVMRGANQALSCYINLQNAEEGENKFTLTEDNIKADKGRTPEVLQVIPPQVVLMLEKTIQKTVPITVPVQGEVASGFEVYEIIPNPNEVTITGPRTSVKSVEDVQTEVINLSGQKQTANFNVSLNYKNGLIRSSISTPIWVEVKIGAIRKLYVVKNVPVSFKEGESFVSSPKTVDIQIMAPEALKEALIPDNFEVTINDQVLQGDAFPVKAQPRILYPDSWTENVKIRGTIPSVVTVERKDKKSGKK